MKKSKLFSNIYLTLIFVFMYLPLLVMIIYSFTAGSNPYRLEGFSVKWYINLMENDQIKNAIFATIIVAILATTISVILGTLSAIGLSKSKKVVRDIMLQVNNLPIVNPEIVTAVSLLLIYIALNIPRGYVAMLIAHIMFCTPYVIITVLPKLRSLDPNLIEAALDLGASPAKALLKVLVPQLWVAISGAAGIAFTMSFDDFMISNFTKGSEGTNISIYLYSQRLPLTPVVYAMSTVIMVSIALIVIIKSVANRKKVYIDEE